MPKTSKKSEGVDFIIIGQGLAGTALAYFLIQKGQDVLVCDDEMRPSSSKVAAGLFNPVTGRKMVRTWMADRLFPFLRKYYRDAERLTGKRFLHEMPLYRPFISVEEQNDWMGRSSGKEFGPFIRKVHTGPVYEGLHDPYGGIMLDQCGYLDVPAYLSSMRQWLRSLGAFHEGLVEVSDIRWNGQWAEVNGIRTGGVICCEGTGVLQNKEFDRLPFRPVKGELLRIRMQAEWPVIPNRGLFLVPAGRGEWIAGSTYDNHDLSWEGTMEGRKQIEEKLAGLTRLDYEVTAHYAGLRPATADRRPIMGHHPEKGWLSIFNGLGTKGVSLSPYWAREFSESLTEGTEVIPEVNISRYFSLY